MTGASWAPPTSAAAAATPSANDSGAWSELESDPGVFTLLLQRMGVSGVQVDEIYELEDAALPSQTVFGYIFLFRWTPAQGRAARRHAYSVNYVKSPETLKHVYFAHQIRENSCATHALLSIMLNCVSCVDVGDLILQLHKDTSSESSRARGLLIGRHPLLEKYHNSFANVNLAPPPDKEPEADIGDLEAVTSSHATADQFHYISFIPVGNSLFELDGLKSHPIDHGAWSETQTWKDKFRDVIRERVNAFDSEVRFNLMAVIPDRRTELNRNLSYLTANRDNLLETTRQLVRGLHPSLEHADQEKLLDQLRLLSPNSGTLLHKGFFDLQRKIPWFNTYPDFLSSPLISDQEKMLYFDIKRDLSPASSETASTSENKPDGSIDTTSVKSEASSSSMPDHGQTSGSIPGVLSPAVKTESDGSMSDDDVLLSSLRTTSSKFDELFVDTTAKEFAGGHFFLTSPKIFQLFQMLDEEISKCETSLSEEIATRKRYLIEHKRRSNNYSLFIHKYFAYAVKYGLLDAEKLANLQSDPPHAESNDSGTGVSISENSITSPIGSNKRKTKVPKKR
jgi:hypothetical protein